MTKPLTHPPTLLPVPLRVGSSGIHDFRAGHHGDLCDLLQRTPEVGPGPAASQARCEAELPEQHGVKGGWVPANSMSKGTVWVVLVCHA